MAEHTAEEQQRLLLHGLRRQIFDLLKVETLTAKEVAVRCGATVGNAHYHLQRLVNGGLVEAEEAAAGDGTVEKRYRPRQTVAAVTAASPPATAWDAGLIDAEVELWLTVAETGQLVNELTALLHRWQTAYQEPRGRTQPVAMALRLGRKPTS